jgi:hypothetical protein
LPTAFGHDRSRELATVDSAVATVPDDLDALDTQELLHEHSECAQPAALDDE